MPSPLPIRRVVLYKHGVAYFERRGQVEGNEALQLDFKSRDMNDVLKSMTVLDLSGGSVSAVSYDSTKPLEKLLEEATIRIPEDGSLTALLGQVKGARVRIQVGQEQVEGAIIGLERMQIAAGETSVERPYLALLASGAVRAFDLTEIRELSFLDETVRKDLEFYLATVLSSYKKDSKRVAVITAGEGRRELFVSYVLEAPVWKTSYRVLLDEKEPVLQGWAVVDNTGDEDWDEVNLSLVSGLPISFVHDLYSPRYLRRPEVRVETEAAAAPVIAEEGMDVMADSAEEEVLYEAAAPAAAAAPMRMMRAGGRPMPAAAPPPPPAMTRGAMERSANVQTITQEVGDLFEYRVEKPVTVHRNQSALVPILHRPFEGKRVLLYNRATREKNPMACIELKNTTGLTLEGGPVTVFDGETYVGEAMLETLKPDDRRLVPFAVELSCTVGREDRGEEGPVFHAAIQHGVLITQYYRVQHARYRVKNKAKRPQVLFLEHPRTGYELFDTPQPAESTESFWRFRLELKPGAEAELAVKERLPGSRQYNFESVGLDDLAFFLSSRFIDQRVVDAMHEVLALRTRVAALNEEERKLIQDRNAIHKDQERLRANLGALKSGADQRELSERIVSKLNLQEDRLEKIEKDLARVVSERDKLAAEARARIQKLSFDADLGQR